MNHRFVQAVSLFAGTVLAAGCYGPSTPASRRAPKPEGNTGAQARAVQETEVSRPDVGPPPPVSQQPAAGGGPAQAGAQAALAAEVSSDDRMVTVETRPGSRAMIGLIDPQTGLQGFYRVSPRADGKYTFSLHAWQEVVLPKEWEPGMPLRLPASLFESRPAIGAQLATEAPAATPPRPVPAVPLAGPLVPRGTPTAGREEAGGPAAVEPDATVPLPGEVTRSLPGGNGRYLLLSIPSLAKIAVFDVREAKVLRYIDVGSPKFLVAAGATRFVVIEISTRRLVRYNLASGAKEAEGLLSPTDAAVAEAAMGVASEGPLLLCVGGVRRAEMSPYRVIDLESLAYVDMEVDPKSHAIFAGNTGVGGIAASSDGTMFLACTPSGSPAALAIRGRRIEKVEGVNLVSDRFLRIASDGGSCFYRNCRRYHGGEQIESTIGGQLSGPCFSDSLWYVADFTSRPSPPAVIIGLHYADEARPVAVLKFDVAAIAAARVEAIARNERFSYSPAEKTLTLLASAPDRLLVKRFDVEAAVSKVDFDLLVVTSTAPATFTPGEAFRYQVETRSKRGGVRYRIESGPTGMTVSSTGLVQWQPPAEASGMQNAILLVTDGSGAEKFHNLRLQAARPPGGEGLAASRPAVVPVLPEGPARTELALPGEVSDFAVAGGGRYLLAHLERLRKLAVIDVRQRAVRRLLPLEGDEVLIAGGATKWVAYIGSQKILTRWNLASLERELTTNVADKYVTLAMGSASEGPILAGRKQSDRPELQPVLLDLDTLKPGAMQINPASAGSNVGIGQNVYAAPDGRTFASWHSTTNSGIFLLQADGADYQHKDFREGINPALPNADGSLIFTRRGVFTGELAAVGSTKQNLKEHREAARMSVPAESGRYCLSWPIAASASPTESMVTLHAQGDESPLAGLPQVDFAPPEAGGRRDVRSDFLHRLMLVPDAEAVVALAGTRDRFYFYPLSIEETLARSSADYLFITSTPPTSATRGTTFSYQIEVRSKRQEVKYRLDVGPEGMKLSETGQLTWQVPTTAAGQQAVVASVTDASGGEVFHTFTLAIVGSTPAPAEGPVAQAAGATPAGARETTVLKLPAAMNDLVVGGGGRYLLAHLKSLQQVVLVDARQKKVLKYIAAADDNVRVAAGATRFVVLLGNKGVLSRYSFASLEREMSVAYAGRDVEALAMGSASEGPLLAGHRTGHDISPQFVDLDTLRPQPLEGFEGRLRRFGNNIRASAEGHVFGGWSTAVSPNGLHSLVLSGNTAEYFNVHSSVGMVIPSPDGRILYTSNGMYTAQAERLSNNDLPGLVGGMPMPAASGPFYLSLKVSQRIGREPQSPGTLTLHVQGQSGVVLTIDDVELPKGSSDFGTARTALHSFDKRLLLLPAAEAMVTVPNINNPDELLIQRFSVEDELARTDVDYLFVASIPPARVDPGAKLSYQLDVRSKRGNVKFRLESGPAGMTISPSGLVTWRVPAVPDDQARNRGEEHVVIVVVSDASGQEIFHSFKLRTFDPPRNLAKPGDKTAEAAPPGGGAGPAESSRRWT